MLEKGPEAKTNLSCRAGRLKKAISCLLFIYLAGPGSLKERQKKLNVLSGMADKFKKGKKLSFFCLSSSGRIDKRQRLWAMDLVAE